MVDTTEITKISTIEFLKHEAYKMVSGEFGTIISHLDKCSVNHKLTSGYNDCEECPDLQSCQYFYDKLCNLCVVCSSCGYSIPDITRCPICGADRKTKYKKHKKV